MKHILRTLITIACISLPFIQNVSAYKAPDLLCQIKNNSSLYAGIEGSLLSPIITGTYSFVEGYGKNAYFNDPLMYGVFVGSRITNRVGVEFGYETQHAQKRLSRIISGDPLPGGVYIGGSIVSMTTEARTEHWRALLTFNLSEPDSKSKLNLWTQAGLSYSQLRASQDVLFFTEDDRPYVVNNDTFKRTFKRKRILPVAKVGMDYNFTEKFAVRSSVGWSNLRLLKAKSIEQPNAQTEIRLKDEYNIALGIVYRFW